MIPDTRVRIIARHEYTDTTRSRDNSAVIVIKLRPGKFGNRGSIPGAGNRHLFSPKRPGGS
jgi:hypothetical protein